MKTLLNMITFLPVILFLGPVSFAATEMNSGTVKAEIEESISKLVPHDKFMVRVSIDTTTVSEKRISEGETITQNNPSNEIKVPPLPGFQMPAPQAANLPAGQSKQTYRMIDKEVLSAVKAQVDFDQSVDAETVDQAKSMARRYLEMSFGSKATIAFNLVRMMPKDRLESETNWFSKNAAWLLAGLASLLLLVALYKLFSGAKAQAVYPRVMNRDQDDESIRSSSLNPFRDSHYSQGGKPSALPSGSFPSLPATVKFIDGRTELLQTFLKNSEIFRIYYGRLSEGAQMELYTGLRGPAFDSLLETLGLSHPKGNENTPPPSEEQMLFYQKNFHEFIDTNSWQNAQFFGFLKQLTPDQLTTLLKQENPVVSAVILKFCKPEDSAIILSSLSSKERTEILDQFYRTQSLSAEELSSVEITVREKVSRLPRLQLGYNQQDTDYWSKVLSHSQNQDELLLDLERSRPDLYPALAKFRFKLEDMPSLPTPLVQKVLDEIDNEELSLALLKCPKSVVDFALAELGVDRRKLIYSHIGMFGGMPNDRVVQARQNVTLKFREVMA